MTAHEPLGVTLDERTNEQDVNDLLEVFAAGAFLDFTAGDLADEVAGQAAAPVPRVGEDGLVAAHRPAADGAEVGDDLFHPRHGQGGLEREHAHDRAPGRAQRRAELGAEPKLFEGAIRRRFPKKLHWRILRAFHVGRDGAPLVRGRKLTAFTDAQIEANIRLVRYLAEKYPTIEYLIGHMEYLDFEGHPLWLELDPGYRTEKTDPGDRFMTAVRDAVADLGLEGPP